jgi:hypothetical protein
MNDYSRKRHDGPLILALACGVSVEQAARQTKVSERSVYRRLQDPEFRRQLHLIRDDMVQRSAGMLTAAALEAVRTLLSLQSATTPPAVRLGAARAILEIGMHVREVSDLAERMAELERQVNAYVVPAA